MGAGNGWFGRARGDWFSVDKNVAGRQSQQGGNVEAGIRIGGPGGVIELFAGYAKVFDADPVDRQSKQWALAGFRLLDH